MFHCEFSGLDAGDVITASYQGDVLFTLGFNGSGPVCLMKGCINPAFCNYHSYANIDDGSCCNSSNCVTLSMYDGGNEVLNATGFHIYHSSGEVIEEGTALSVDEWYQHFCAYPGCFILIIDDNGPGNPITWDLAGASGGTISGTGAGSFTFTVGGDFLGCTDPNASNYEPTATCDDGSCEHVSGCTISTACNFNPLATIEDGSCYELVEYEAYVLNYGAPTVLQLTISGVVNETLNLNLGTNASISIFYCAAPGCLTFQLSEGTDPTNGAQLVVYANGDVIGLGNNTGFLSFCVVQGCIDNTACNYNAAADVEDGSCTYAGCTNPLAVNYDPTAGCDNGQCILNGNCTNENACNYNPSATVDDGSCVLGFQLTVLLTNSGPPTSIHYQLPNQAQTIIYD